MLFDLLKKNDINQGVTKWKQTEGAVLLDVRTSEEYHDGHIPESINIDVNEIYKITNILSDKNIPLFVYCRSGARSNRAVNILKGMGYTNAKNIGGINQYNGKVTQKTN